MTQETIALSIVVIAFISLGIRFFWLCVAGPLSQKLLKRGRVKWAMALRRRAKQGGAGCDGCR